MITTSARPPNPALRWGDGAARRPRARAEGPRRASGATGTAPPGDAHHGGAATLRDALRALAGFCTTTTTRSRYAASPGRVVCAGRIGAAWAARTERHVPSSHCSTKACAAGATITATARTVGATVPGTSCHSRAGPCRSRCSRTGTTRSTSPTGPVRPNGGMRPCRHRRHGHPCRQHRHGSIPGRRRPRGP